MTLKKFTTTLLLLLSIMTVNAQNSESVIKVRGEAVVRAVPEILNINIPIQSKAKTYEEATNILTSTFNDLNAALVKAGIDKEKIYSNQLNISEDYNYQDRERVLVGYVGNIILYLEVPYTEKSLNQVMRTLNNERFNFGYQVSFSFSESQKDSLREAAIKLAVKDAKAKAKTLSEALDVKLVEIKEINFEFSDGGNDNIIMRQSVYAQSKMADGGSDIKLNPQEQEISKSVGVIWRISQ